MNGLSIMTWWHLRVEPSDVAHDIGVQRSCADGRSAAAQQRKSSTVD